MEGFAPVKRRLRLPVSISPDDPMDIEEETGSDRLAEYVRKKNLRVDLGAEVRSEKARKRVLQGFVGGYGSKSYD